jgi:hypothetical protein
MQGWLYCYIVMKSSWNQQTLRSVYLTLQPEDEGNIFVLNAAFHRATRRYVPEDRVFFYRCSCENFKSKPCLLCPLRNSLSVGEFPLCWGIPSAAAVETTNPNRIFCVCWGIPSAAAVEQQIQTVSFVSVGEFPQPPLWKQQIQIVFSCPSECNRISANNFKYCLTKSTVKKPDFTAVSDPPRWLLDIPLSNKLALTSPTSGGR